MSIICQYLFITRVFTTINCFYPPLFSAKKCLNLPFRKSKKSHITRWLRFLFLVFADILAKFAVCEALQH